MNFLDDCELQNDQNDDDLSVSETTETNSVKVMRTETDWKKSFYNMITENIVTDMNVVDDDMTTTNLNLYSLSGELSLTEIDRNTPDQGEEDPFSKKQKVILDYELNGNEDSTRGSLPDNTRYKHHYGLNNSRPEVDKNNCAVNESNLKLLIFLITHHVFSFLRTFTVPSI